MKKQKYDYLFSIGQACRPAHNIERFGLRQNASPLDWMMGDDLSTVIHLFKTGVEDFFLNVKEIPEEKGIHNKYVVDTKNGIISIHHFANQKNLEIEQQSFRKTMLNRYAKVRNFINSSKHVGIICNRDSSLKELEDFLINFSNLFSNIEFTIINIKDTPVNDINHEEIVINSKLSIIQYTFNDTNCDGPDKNTNPNYWIGNQKNWDKVFSNIWSTSNEINMISHKKRAYIALHTVSTHLAPFGSRRRNIDIKLLHK